MAKEELKKKILKTQNGLCVLTGEPLPEDLSLLDTDREQQKAEGGIYTEDNTRVVTPVAHMARHGNLRLRDKTLDKLKALVDDREQTMKLYNKINNQLLAYQRRTDNLNNSTIAFLTDHLESVEKALKEVTKKVEKEVKNLAKVNPFVATIRAVSGIGDITVAYCLVYIILEKAPHVSSLWKYAGLHAPSHKRYPKKGESTKGGGGNKALRTALWNMANSQEKNMKGAYRPIYDQVKARLAQSDKIVETRNTQGVLVKVPWKEAKPCHRQGAAKRAVMKHFLADYWYVGRTLAGLPTNPPYAEAILGKEGHRTVDPRARGWVF